MSKASALGFSSERLQRIDRFLEERYVGPGRIPCAQFVLARRGEVVHQTLLGQQDPARGTAIRDDTVFRIYSMTKPVTSVALMMLVEEGRIALDDPVAKHIPSWAELGVFAAGVDGAWVTTPPKRPMQVVDLLRHTSGLTYGFQYRSNVDAAYRRRRIDEIHAGGDLGTLIDRLSRTPLEFSPGEAWNYSVSTDVVGYLVQTISGEPLDVVLRRRIFEPLGMGDTGFQVRDDQRARFAACWQLTDGKITLQDDPQTSPFLGPPEMLSGGGGLVSTARDYMRFCQMLLNGGALDGARILSPRTLRLMTANHLPGGKDLTQVSRSLFSESTNAGVGFGLGFAVTFDPAAALLPSSPGEYYWGGMASTAFWVDPLEELTAVFMTQLIPSSANPIRRELRTLVYSALTDPNG